MSDLERLNELVEIEMDIPEYRMKVDRSGRNLAWLRKVAKKQSISDELASLLAMEISELVKV